LTYLELKGIEVRVSRKSNPSFVNGVPELLVLQLLARREMYGYEVVKAIQTTSREAFNFGEGSIYPVLHQLEGQKLLKSRRAEVDGRSRLYYALTPAGRKRLEALAKQWSEVTAGVANFLGGAHA
jgi:PadR family transcriptional regulator, regulatory protein PadR